MGILRIYEVIKARNSGEVVNTSQEVLTAQSVALAHKAQRATESAGKAVTLGEVEARYLKAQNQNSYTRKIVGAVTLFADVIGRERSVHSLLQLAGSIKAPRYSNMGGTAFSTSFQIAQHGNKNCA